MTSKSNRPEPYSGTATLSPGVDVQVYAWFQTDTRQVWDGGMKRLPDETRDLLKIHIALPDGELLKVNGIAYKFDAYALEPWHAGDDPRLENLYLRRADDPFTSATPKAHSATRDAVIALARTIMADPGIRKDVQNATDRQTFYDLLVERDRLANETQANKYAIDQMMAGRPLEWASEIWKLAAPAIIAPWAAR